MSWILEYLVSLVISTSVISSLFIFKGFWAKTAKSGWVRGIVFVWMIGWVGYYYYLTLVQDKHAFDDFNTAINKLFYWELCNVVAFVSMILMIFPRKYILDFVLPLAIIGPTLTILTPTEESMAFTFGDARYYQFYLSHLGSLFGFLYVYLYGVTKAEFGWQMVRRSYLFSFFLLTFVLFWNIIFMKGGVNPLSHPTDPNDITGENGFFPNFIFRDIINNVNLGHLNMIGQYFMMIMILGPFLLLCAYTVLWFARPMYADSGRTKLTINYKKDPLDLRRMITKEFWLDTKDKINND